MLVKPKVAKLIEVYNGKTYRKAFIFRGLYISRIYGKLRFREKNFRENRMEWYRGGDRWHITHAYIIKCIDLVQH